MGTPARPLFFSKSPVGDLDLTARNLYWVERNVLILSKEPLTLSKLLRNGDRAAAKLMNARSRDACAGVGEGKGKAKPKSKRVALQRHQRSG